jgi:hypothetical protein
MSLQLFDSSPQVMSDQQLHQIAGDGLFCTHSSASVITAAAAVPDSSRLN